jgi:hypothetical protein
LGEYDGLWYDRHIYICIYTYILWIYIYNMIVYHNIYIYMMIRYVFIHRSCIQIYWFSIFPMDIMFFEKRTNSSIFLAMDYSMIILSSQSRSLDVSLVYPMDTWICKHIYIYIYIMQCESACIIHNPWYVVPSIVNLFHILSLM